MITITPERKTELILDAVLERPSTDLTRTERKFREEIVAAASEIEKKGGIVEIPFELPDLPPKIKQFFNENHDEIGRFTFGAGTEGGGTSKADRMGDLLARLSKADGGFTIQPITGDEPKFGSKNYAVSLPGREEIVNANEISEGKLLSFMEKNNDAWGDASHYFGAWHDPESGRIFLDVSIVKSDAGEAARIAKENNQYAYFDFENGKSVPIEGREP